MTTSPAEPVTQTGQPITESERPERHRISRWGKAIFAGVIAGTLFTTVEMLLIGAAGKGDIWDPLRLSASIAMGNRAVARSTAFTFDVFFIGMLMHYTLSILYTVVLGMVIRQLRLETALAVSAGFGLLLYVVHFYGLVFMYPWVAEARSWMAVVGHLVFGLSAAWVYKHLHVRSLMEQTHFALEPNTH